MRIGIQRRADAGPQPVAPVIASITRPVTPSTIALSGMKAAVAEVAPVPTAWSISACRRAESPPPGETG